MRDLVILLLSSLLPPTIAAAQESAADCARIDNDRERLACFDRLFSAGGDVGESTTTPGSAVIDAVPAENRLGVRDRSGRGSDPVASRNPPPGGDFGLQKKTLELGGESMTATASGSFGFWEPGQRIELANGQVWRITNDTGVYYKVDNPQVTIRKGLFSAFYLHIDGLSKALKVERIR